MQSNHSFSHDWISRPTLHPQRAKWLRRTDAIAQLIGATAIVVGHGLRRTGVLPWEFGLIVIAMMLTISCGTVARFRWSLAQPSFSRRNWATTSAAASWAVGVLAVTILGPIIPDTNGDLPGGPRYWGYVHWSEFVLGLYALHGVIHGLRKVTAKGANPAVLLAGSFLTMIAIGTIVLMLPICRQNPISQPASGAPFLTAFFTATSATCVTGLIVVDTPTYWSHVGQVVILILFQIGGLGIMTFGAFFAVIAGRNVRLSEFATIRDLLSSDGVGDIRKLIQAILGFTLVSEIIGALLLLPLWKELPLGERLWMAGFHSVSAFCNAGFAITENSFVGFGGHWSVSCVLAALIIVGGLGFGVTYNIVSVMAVKVRDLFRSRLFRIPQERIRLHLTSKLVLITTAILLVAGTITVYMLERINPGHGTHISIGDAWFQSVTFRTAGFNTVDIGELQPSTKLVAIFLMIIGASPGSTGGGIKTAVFAVSVVGLVSILRGRNDIEAFGRTIPGVTVIRALAIFFVSMTVIFVTTVLLVIFEGRPELFLDHLFEATSAVGTVGVSSSTSDGAGGLTSLTSTLTSPSRMTIIVAMFLGRIGPLTLLLALAGENQQARYQYPTERVTLG